MKQRHAKHPQQPFVALYELANQSGIGLRNPKQSLAGGIDRLEFETSRKRDDGVVEAVQNISPEIHRSATGPPFSWVNPDLMRPRFAANTATVLSRGIRFTMLRLCPEQTFLQDKYRPIQ